MPTVKAFIRTTSKDKATAKIRFRLSDGRDVQLFHVSELEVNPALWDSKKEQIKAKVIYNQKERNELFDKISARKSLILDIYSSREPTDELTSKWLEAKIAGKQNGNSENPTSFFDLFDQFLSRHKVSEVRIKNIKVVYRALKRYERYKQIISDPTYGLDLDRLTPAELEDIENYFINENNHINDYPELKDLVAESRQPGNRGQNTVNGFMEKLRTFVLWANNAGYTDNNPFKRYSIKESVFGTPYYITIEERNKIYKTNLSRHPQLSRQRDVFVFQCLIGCRVSDLYKLTRDNVIAGAIEYIARKTKEGRPYTVRVPLNTTAKEILDKYQTEKTLLPLISEQKYNQAIKKIFLAARITRPVVILNQTTREPEIRKINEIASSHLARRCFVGNLYKKVKDPNLISALSGHKEGSSAFLRYRDIDEEMKQELVSLLE